MRWIKKTWERDQLRERTGFLFFPKTINNETRWLEFARWEEKQLNYSGTMPLWSAERWLD
jgi:hypothetical protein